MRSLTPNLATTAEADPVIKPDGVHWPGPPAEPGDDVTLIPEGEYEMTYVRHVIRKMFSRDCCVVWFRIVSMGEHFGKELPRYYNCRKIGKRSVTAGPMSALWREFVAATGRKPQMRRVPVSHFSGGLLVGRVTTVRTDRDQDKLPDGACYSKVAKILGRAGL